MEVCKGGYQAVIFDLGGTLRIALDDEPYMRHARRKLAEIAGTAMPFEDFYQLVEDRYEPYRRWALLENREAGDKELWTRWLLPDYDRTWISKVCHELSFQYRQTKGRRVLVEGGMLVLKTLRGRGYRLGIVSNLIGENEISDWLEEDRLDDCFDSVVLSSVCRLRKPCAEIYHIAARELGVAPEACVSVADNVKRDIAGAKAAGIGCNIIFRSPEEKHPVEFTEANRPDAVISRFTDLLGLLPAVQSSAPSGA